MNNISMTTTKDNVTYDSVVYPAGTELLVSPECGLRWMDEGCAEPTDPATPPFDFITQAQMLAQSVLGKGTPFDSGLLARTMPPPPEPPTPPERFSQKR